MIAWSVWTRRNKLRCKEPSLPPEKILDHARSLLSEFQCKATAKPQKPNQVPIKWNPPNCEALKINYDGAVFADTFEAGIGVVIRDGSGTVVAALPEKIAMPTSVEPVEILAARRTAQFTVELGFQQAIFEGDSELVFKALSEGVQSLSPLGHHVKDFMSIAGSLRAYSFSHTRM